MGKVKKKGFKFLLSFITGILCGVLIGSSIITVLVSYRMDALHEKIANLESIIVTKDDKLKNLEKSINNKNMVLKDIEIILDFKGDDIDYIEIEKNLKEKYSSLIGKEVKSLDADILVEVADKRIFKLEENEYKLTVNKIVLTEILRLWVKAELIDN